MANLFSRIRSSAPVRAIARITQKIHPPGFEGLPLYDVLKFFLNGIHKGAITTRASSLAFSFFLALFPSAIFLFTLIPYIPVDGFQDSLLAMIKNFMPRDAFETMRETLEDIIHQQRGGLLSFGFVTALYFSTNGFNAMIGAFNQSYHQVETRSLLMQRLVSVLLVFIQTVLLLTATALLVYAGYLEHQLEGGAIGSWLLFIGKVAVVFALCLCSISATYYLGPAKRQRWKFVTAGSTFATVLSIITSLGFAYYVNNFDAYNKIYGSIGTLIVILLWIYFNSVILLLGFELNASIANAKKKKTAPAPSSGE